MTGAFEIPVLGIFDSYISVIGEETTPCSRLAAAAGIAPVSRANLKLCEDGQWIASVVFGGRDATLSRSPHLGVGTITQTSY
jgi:hypothetical protein